MNTFVILSEKIVHEQLLLNVKTFFPEFKWIHLKTKNDFNLENLQQLNPKKIFIPHWSQIIPETIYTSFDCVVFHMTDLPFGRGGSPLQNLIVRGYSDTKISAIKVEQKIDAGPIYLKESLGLFGTAEEILLRAAIVIEGMIIKIIQENILPTPQKGDATIFHRRKPEHGNLQGLESIEQIYDYIRMLDADGYPRAFIEIENFRIEFSEASTQSNKELIANVRIIKK